MAVLRQLPGARRHLRFGVTAATALLVLLPAACGGAATRPQAAPSPSTAGPRASAPQSVSRSVSRSVSPAGSTQLPPGGAPSTASPGTTGAAPAPAAAVTPDPYAGRRPPPGSVLARLPRSPRGPVTAAGVAPLLAPLLHASQLGPRVGVLVVDPYTGAVPYSAGATTPLTPASTLKLLTATAVLDRYGAAHRFRTRVLLAPRTPGRPARVVLVGGGDPSLTSVPAVRSGGVAVPGEAGELGEAGEPGGAAPAVPVSPLVVANPTRLPNLVATTVRALRARGVTRVAVAVDDTLFTGPKVNPAWPRNDVPDGFVSPVDALAVDNGRVRPGSGARSPDPARAAGQLFAKLLGQAGISVTGGVTHTTARAGTPVVAAASSPPLAALLQRMLQASDNDYAEDLFRQVVAGTSVPASAAAASRAVHARLAALGIDLTGTVQYDGSGLSHGDRARPVTLAAVVRLDLWTPRLSSVITGLPVSGRSGSLIYRMGGAHGPAAGRVVAKTGTLTGIHGLAGYVLGVSADPLVFVFMAGGSHDDAAAEDRLDDAAVALARCGCHR